MTISIKSLLVLEEAQSILLHQSFVLPDRWPADIAEKFKASSDSLRVLIQALEAHEAERKKESNT